MWHPNSSAFATLLFVLVLVRPVTASVTDDLRYDARHDVQSYQDAIKIRGGEAVLARKACGLFVWDAPSAFLSMWCNHMLKDKIYEGRGGHKFVRITPGSVLQLLYPCSKYSRDRCLLCGGSFNDHLTLWWSPNLYTPFDRHLDETLQKGTITVPSETQTEITRVKKRGKLHVIVEPKMVQRRVFHRQYVLDASTLYAKYWGDDISNTKTNRRKSHNKKVKVDLSNVEAYRATHPELGTQMDYYSIPATAQGESGNAVERLLHKALKAIALSTVDNLIRIEIEENNRLDRKQ